MLTIGTILDGRYEIIEQLAEGGMGAVFRARRTLLGDEVAVKIMLAAFGAEPAARERFFRESRACAQLRHPNIVSLYDFNVDPGGRPFMVMELLSGPSLREELSTRGALPLAEVQNIVRPLIGALQLAHDRGVLHRDLKPANVVAHDFGGGTRVHKIVDFGLALVRASSSATRLTAANQFVGTIAYASPEQLTAGPIDARSDLYSFAAMCFEMLTGSVPFPGDDPVKVVTALLSQPAPAASSRRAGLPTWVDLVLARALAKSPDDRFASMAEFGASFIPGDAWPRDPIVVSAPSRAAGSALLATYDIGERLAPGRLGSDVFRGTHRALGHPVAIRLLRRGTERNWDAVRARFLHEAKTLQLAHPSIIQVRDYGEEGDLVYVVTDLIEGRSLREVLQQDGAMAWTRLLPLLGHLVEASRLLHRRGGLLCGVSPEIMRVTPDDDGERLMISTSGVWQAQDLLATLRDQTLRGIALADVELHYVAPELLTGHNADVRSDVFTIGVLAYEMATAVRPYEGATMAALLGEMLQGQPENPQLRAPTLPDGAAAAILKALSPDANMRFADVRAFGAALVS